MQLMQEISVSSGLRSSFIDARGGAVGSAIMALGNAMVLALTTRKCRSCGSGSDSETRFTLKARVRAGSTGRPDHTLAWPGLGLGLSGLALSALTDAIGRSA